VVAASALCTGSDINISANIVITENIFDKDLVMLLSSRV
jgi:hypothetical protein